MCKSYVASIFEVSITPDDILYGKFPLETPLPGSEYPLAAIQEKL